MALRDDEPLVPPNIENYALDDATANLRVIHTILVEVKNIVLMELLQAITPNNRPTAIATP